MNHSVLRLSLALCVVAIVRGAVVSTPEERLAEARNLGKAFYENPTTAREAVTEFRRALDMAPDSAREKLNYALALLRQGDTDRAVALLGDVQKQDPSLPHTWFNLGIYYRKNGEAEKAISQFQAMLRLTPLEAIPHYQLGALLRQTGEREAAIAQFARASQLDPLLAAPHFQLYNLYRQAGDTSAADRELAFFQDLKKRQEGAVVPEDTDWSFYAEIYDPPIPARSPTRPEQSAVVSDRTLPGRLDPATAGLALMDSSGKGQVDVLAWSSRGVTLYRKGTVRANDSGLERLRDVISVAAGDFDNDGLTDLCVLTADGPVLFRNTGGRFVPFAADLPKRRFVRALWLDYDHDNDLDLLLFGETPVLMRNQGKGGFAERTSDFPFVPGQVTDAWRLRLVPDSKAFDVAVSYAGRKPVLYRDDLAGKYEVADFTGSPRDTSQVEADFGGPGSLATVRIEPDGSLRRMQSRMVRGHHWIRIQLAGIRSPKAAQDAEVEIKAGTLYLKSLYDGVPLFFDTGDYDSVDVVRITWPNGLIQNETRQATGKTHRYEEAQRLSGSCPMIWTWDGDGYRFITDVLGVAPLGASDGDGGFFAVNHSEHVVIPAGTLRPANGRLEIRITEELSEVTYLDQTRLYAIDHPAGTEIFANDKFQSPPFPAPGLYRSDQRIYPVAARDEQGDVLPRLIRADGLAPDRFPRTALGTARMHTLEIDFGKAAPAGAATLLLNGWVDWADGSVFRAASQEGDGGLVMPYLQMQDARGEWKTVNPDMGLPSGKPKTIAVDLKFLSSARRIRIVTNLCIYWDEIFLSETPGMVDETVSAPVARRQLIPLATADLRFRGFSRSHIDPARLQPDTYEYAAVTSNTFWNPTPGLYTRYGSVSELLTEADDRFIIMGSGDEVKLSFSPTGLTPPPSGWVRDYLLEVDGWAKDSDPNTAFSSSVLPLPFHAMSGYPYGTGEHYPDDEAHNSYQRTYNTRPALLLLRPLTDLRPPTE